MQVYLVGGAVRDYVLGRTVTEHDYVVVGATPMQMLELGFSQVGADFPVFLHPKTRDEYALARTERKSGNGYHGFNVYADPSVTLAEDLIRRDLTINAMAIEVNGLFDSAFKVGEFDLDHVIDPYGGLTDIAIRKLRHVSQAFTEDPVRVLRLARFASRYAPLGFDIADETKILVQQMRQAGELNHLVAERVWSETFRSLVQSRADVYFETLLSLNVMAVIMPTLHQTATNNPNLFQLALAALKLAGQLNCDVSIKFALLSSCFIGNPSEYLIFCNQLKSPKHFERNGLFFINHFDALAHFDLLHAESLFKLLKVGNSLKDPTQLQQSLLAIHIYQLAKQTATISTIQNHLSKISAQHVSNDLKDKQIGEAIDNLRLKKLTEILHQQTL